MPSPAIGRRRAGGWPTARRGARASTPSRATQRPTSARNAFIRAAVEADIIVRTVEMKLGEEIVDPKPFALVVVKIAPGQLRDINSVRDAAEALARRLADEGRRPAYRAAVQACHDALAGTVTPEVARHAFIAPRRRPASSCAPDRAGEAGDIIGHDFPPTPPALSARLSRLKRRHRVAGQ